MAPSNNNSDQKPGDDDGPGNDTRHHTYQLPHVETIAPIRDPEDEPYVFRFELGPAILQQLLVKLDTIEVRPIRDARSAKHPGFYQLFLDGRPVYIGKTARAIRARINEHMKKLRVRMGTEIPS